MLLVLATIILAPTCASALSIGYWDAWPTIGQQFNDKVTGYLGYCYYGQTSRSYLLAKVDYNLMKLGDVQTKVGGFYIASSPSVRTDLGLTWGASIMATKNLSVGFDIILLDSESFSGSSYTDILPYSTITANIYF